MRVVLVRHTEVEKPSQFKFIGRRDVSLSEAGQSSARTIAQNLCKKYKFDQIYSSHLKRCQHLAKQYVALSKIPFSLDERIVEFDFGEWEGLSLEQVFKEDANANLLYPPGGERIEEFEKRIFSFWEEKVLTSNVESLLVVSHGGTIKFLLTKLQGLSLDSFWNIPQEYGAVNEIEIDTNGSVEVKRINDLSFATQATKEV